MTDTRPVRPGPGDAAALPIDHERIERAVREILEAIGEDPDRDGLSAWTRAHIADLIQQRFGHRYHVSSLSKILRALGFSRQKTRPSHPNADPKARD